MVVRDPIWTLRKFSATIIGDVWPEVLLFTIIATGNPVPHLNTYIVMCPGNWLLLTVVVVVSEHTNVNLGVSNQLLTVLGFVLGLVISFRTSSAYERCVLNCRFRIYSWLLYLEGTRRAKRCGQASRLHLEIWPWWWFLVTLVLHSMMTDCFNKDLDSCTEWTTRSSPRTICP